jgi:ferritin-like protein
MPQRVALELVERAGIDLDKLREMLVRNAAAELTTFYYYTILRVNLIGLEGEGLKQIAEDARIEDRNHFEALVPRIYELGGKLPDSMVEFHNISACPPANLRGSVQRSGDAEDPAGSRAMRGAGLHRDL